MKVRLQISFIRYIEEDVCHKPATREGCVKHLGSKTITLARFFHQTYCLLLHVARIQHICGDPLPNNHSIIGFNHERPVYRPPYTMVCGLSALYVTYSRTKKYFWKKKELYVLFVQGKLRCHQNAKLWRKFSRKRLIVQIICKQFAKKMMNSLNYKIYTWIQQFCYRVTRSSSMYRFFSKKKSIA